LGKARFRAIQQARWPPFAGSAPRSLGSANPLRSRFYHARREPRQKLSVRGRTARFWTISMGRHMDQNT
jgi:hypothetical protein